MSYGTVQAEKMTTESGYSLGAGNASSFKNRIINGQMQIDQRNNGASVANGGTATSYAVDRTSYVTSLAPSATAQRVTDAPTGFTNSLLITVTSGSLSSTAYGLVLQAIEGVNFDDFAWGTASAKPLTLSALVKVSVAGTYSIYFRNAIAFTRYYITTVTISSANTWTAISVTVPGDTSGTWAAGTGAALQVGFTLGTGSGYITSGINTWSNGTQFAGTGSVNMYSTSGATFQITGWQVEAGTVATSFDYRSYGTELFLCQRYYEKGGMSRRSGNRSGGSYETTPIFYKATKRAAPTFALSGGYTLDGWTTYTVGAHDNPSGSNDPTYWGNMECIAGGGGANSGAVMACLWTSSAEI